MAATEFWKYLLSDAAGDIFGTDDKAVADAAIARDYELVAGTKDAPEVDTDDGTSWPRSPVKASSFTPPLFSRSSRNQVSPSMCYS